ncbi:hypothetical protein [Lactobacillus sp. LL6]|uniref:hypothetical protein n=1 Tax=Lactobacillus sp. LL6 TaxID=2596827 RepID=UPI00118623BA|nr:hypothetical protein [Lactobacillus sp. LL6]TSO25426.1 hypothetical protein FOD82_09355 [Lactobacillus sp. LL6]
MGNKVKTNYKGKTYYYLEDFGKDNGIDSKTVKDRWFRGHRNPEKLLHSRKIPFKFKGFHKLTYNRTQFLSLIEFCRNYNLNYRKALDLWKKNIRDPQEIKTRAVIKDKKTVLASVKQSDISNIQKIVNKHGYLTSAQVAPQTGIQAIKIRDQITRMLAKQKNNMGVLASDIVEVNYSASERTLDTKNTEVLSKHAFKPSVVKHIKDRLSIVNKPSFKLVPFENDNYY